MTWKYRNILNNWLYQDTDRFIQLKDAPSSFSGQANKVVSVNAGATGLEFTTNVTTDELVKVSANDTTAGYLNGKLTAGSGIALTENNDGANETLSIANTLTTGLAGGQTIYGDTADNGNLTIQGTLSATKTTSSVLLQPDGGKVGIGTSTPDDLLELSGINQGIRITDTSTGGIPWRIRSYSSGIAGGGALIIDDMVAVAGRFRINSNGDVVFAKLVGGAAVSSDLTLQTTSGVGASGADMHFLVGNNGATEAITILNSGYVGIGTTAPTDRLALGNGGTSSTRAQITFFQSDNTSYSALVGSAIGADDLVSGCALNDFVLRTNSNKLIVTTDNGVSAAMTILSTNNVGLGTTVPTSQLNLYGAAQTTAAITDAGVMGATLYLQDNATVVGGGGTILFGDISSGAAGFAAIKGLLTNGEDNSTGDLAFSTRNAITDVALTERLRLLANGNFGIGTAAPKQLLQVGSSWTGSLATVLVNPSGLQNVSPNIISAGSSTNTTVYVQAIGLNLHNDDITTTGTRVPALAFSRRAGAAYTDVLGAIDAIDEAAGLDANWRAGGLAFHTANAGSYGITEKMRIDNVGNVGIGIAAPLSLLHINGGASPVINLIGSSGAPFLRISDSPTSSTRKELVISYNLTNNYATIQSIQQNTAYTPLNLQPSGGNVGIGTTAPLRRLDINEASGNCFRLIYNDADGSPANYVDFLVSSGGDLTITPSGGSVTLGTSTDLTTGTIELGDASDTTLARVSAGVVSIEGVNILTVAGGTLTGNLIYGENTATVHDNALSADGKYTGEVIAGTAGAALAFGDLVYLDPTDSRWELVDANSASAADGDARGILGICVLAAVGDGSATTVLLRGFVRADTAFPTLTVNAPSYVSETAGDITETQPITTDAVIRTVGFGFDANTLYFCPSSDFITHT